MNAKLVKAKAYIIANAKPVLVGVAIGLVVGLLF